MEHIDLEQANCMSSHSTVPKSENGTSHTSHQCVSIRTRMTVDIDLSDTVIENHYPVSQQFKYNEYVDIHSNKTNFMVLILLVKCCIQGNCYTAFHDKNDALKSGM